MNWKKLQFPSEKCWSLLLISLWKLLNQRIKSNSSSNRCGNIHWQNYLFTYKYLTDMSPHLNRVVITKWWYFHQWEEAVRWQLANVCVWSLAWASQAAIMLQSVALQTYWSDQHDTPQAYGSDQHDTLIHLKHMDLINMIHLEHIDLIKMIHLKHIDLIKMIQLKRSPRLNSLIPANGFVSHI